MNQPTGESFIRHGSKKCTVKLGLDGHEIVRVRGDGINSYSLDGQEFHAFGMGVVPVPIASLLNISDINFQRQLDSPFWFLKSPGEVSRELNEIVNLDLIDRVLSNVSSEQRRAKSTIEMTQERLGIAQKQKDELAWVVEADAILSDLEAKERQLEDVRDRRTKLEQLVRVLGLAEDERRESTAIVQQGGNLLRLGHQICDIRKKRENLLLLCNSIKEAEQAVKNRIPQKAFDKISTLKAEWEEISSKRNRLELLIKQLQQAEEEAWQAKKSVTAARERLNEATGENCPLCGSPMS